MSNLFSTKNYNRKKSNKYLKTKKNTKFNIHRNMQRKREDVHTINMKENIYFEHKLITEDGILCFNVVVFLEIIYFFQLCDRSNCRNIKSVDKKNCQKNPLFLIPNVKKL